METVKARRLHFVDVFSSSSSLKRLKIPVGFAKHLESRTSGSVSLIGPSGNTWHIDLIEENDGLFFDCGWEVFVRDHHLECGDILVFGYDGELCFTVQVFDLSSCEKDAAFHSKCSQDPSFSGNNAGNKRERQLGAALSNQDSQSVAKKIRGCSSESSSGNINKNQEAEVDVDVSGKVLRVLPLQSFSVARKEDDLNPQDSGGLSMLEEYEEKKIAQSFTSSFPFFVRTMKRFNVGGSYTLNIPYKFATEHFPNCKTEIVLRNLKGAYWTVNSVPTTRVHTSHTFCGGWLAFVRSNDIKFGDICIFELVRKCELRVHILRVGKEDLDRQSGKADSSGLNVGSAATSQKMFKNMPNKLGKNSSKIQSKYMKKLQMGDNKGSKMLDEKKYGTASKKSASLALCSLSRRGNERPEEGSGGLRMMLALDEERAAQSFASSFPHFVRIMKKFNISGSYTLKIPYKFSMAHLPDCKTEIVLRNLLGECWTVNSVPDSKGRNVHTFCGGWMSFVRDNSIKMGDICIFELVSKSEMRVHISGVGRDVLD
ncbi:hypothetical protein SLA2020_310370 [Shorea laevis]